MEDSDVARFEEMVALLVWRQRRRFAETLSALGLTMPQFLALMFIQAHGGSVAIGTLAEATEQCSATMTGIVDRLASTGLVERRRDPNDRRSVIVSLTAEGEALLERARAQRMERTRQLLAHFTPEERADIMRYLERYLDVLARESQGADPCTL